MSDKRTEPPASPTNTNVLSTIEAQGSWLAALVIQQVATNAAVVGSATSPLMTGSNWAAAINGMRKKPILITSEVHSSGDVRPVNTESTDTAATSHASTSSVTTVLLTVTVRAAGRT